MLKEYYRKSQRLTSRCLLSTLPTSTPITFSVWKSLKRRNRSGGWLGWQQGFDRLMAAVGGNRGWEIGQGIQFSEITSFGNGQEASGGQVAGGAAVAEANLAPLHPRAEPPFRAVIGRLDTFLFQGPH